MFTEQDIIHTYTRLQAIEDGVLVDANQDELDEVTRQHFKVPVAMTYAVFALIQKAVENERHCNDYKGVWHDVMWMCHLAARRHTGPALLFKVIITGAGRKRYHTFKAVMGPMGPYDPSPCLTIMMPDED